ncbi:MAG: hypothetical protein K2Q20_00835 [Phycisphaerales bacterium]|nr:hypothetical protein [Phycisphaerales bacterium]
MTPSIRPSSHSYACLPVAAADGRSHIVSTFGLSGSYTALGGAFGAVFLAGQWVWFTRYIGQPPGVLELASIACALVMMAWAALLTGTHHRIVFTPESVVVHSCWWGRPAAARSHAPRRCRLVVAPCELWGSGPHPGPLPGYWVELATADGSDRIVLACWLTVERAEESAQAIARASGLPIDRSRRRRRDRWWSPMLPRPALLRLILYEHILGWRSQGSARS